VGVDVFTTATECGIADMTINVAIWMTIRLDDTGERPEEVTYVNAATFTSFPEGQSAICERAIDLI
jgi:hypothetical protein